MDPGLAGFEMALNFVDSDVREFARVFSEVLKRPYALDPNVMGQVTVRSGGHIDGNRALALARQALETTGNTIRLSDSVFRATPLSAAGGLDGGTTRTFTLNHIDPAAAQNALAGLLQGRADIVATTGNSLTLRGDQETLQMVGAVVSAIDVDKFATAPFGLFPLQNGTASTVTEEVRSLYSGVDVTPPTLLSIDRINAVLVIAARPEHLEFTRKWVTRLEQRSETDRQVYVYAVRNRDTADLAKLLTDIFSGTVPAPSATVANGGDTQPLTAEGSFLSGSNSEDKMTVTADTGANKLIIRARAVEYKAAMEALSRLDTPPAQV